MLSIVPKISVTYISRVTSIPMESPFYLIVQGGFVLLTVVYISLFIREIHKGLAFTAWESSQKIKFISTIIVTLLSWAVFVTVWSISGKMSDFSLFPFNMMPVILIPIIIALLFITSKKVTEILRHIPPENLIRLQSF